MPTTEQPYEVNTVTNPAELDPIDRYITEDAEFSMQELKHRYSHCQEYSSYMSIPIGLTSSGLVPVMNKFPEEKISDFTITGQEGGPGFPCVMELLKHASGYCSTFFEANPDARELQLDNISQSYLYPIIEFIHCGTLNLKPSNAYGYLVVADYLQMDSLTNDILDYCQNNQIREYDVLDTENSSLRERVGITPFVVSDLYHLAISVANFHDLLDQKVSDLVTKNYEIMWNPVYIRFYTEEFVDKHLFDKMETLPLPCESSAGYFLIEWILYRKRMGLPMTPETVQKWARLVKWDRVHKHIIDSLSPIGNSPANIFASVLTESLVNDILEKKITSSLGRQEYTGNFRHWDSNIVFTPNTSSLLFDMPGARHTIAEAFAYLPLLQNVKTLAFTDRFAGVYKGFSGIDSASPDFEYEDQWETLMDTLIHYHLPALTQLDFSDSVFFEGFDFSLLERLKTIYPDITVILPMATA